MAVGVVALDAFPQPNDVRDPEVLSEDCFVIAFVEAGIARLDTMIQQTLFRGDNGPAPVSVDGAAFQNNRPAFIEDLSQGEAETVGYGCRDALVLPVVAVLGPPVEAELHRLTGSI